MSTLKNFLDPPLAPFKANARNTSDKLSKKFKAFKVNGISAKKQALTHKTTLVRRVFFM